MKKNYKSVLLLVSLCFLFVYSLFHTEMMVREIIQYISIFLTKLFPTSFLFLLLSSLIMEYQIAFYLQKILRKNSLPFYFFGMSFLSGFPSGAVFIRDFLLRDIISVEDANRYIRFAHFPNPLFVLHMVYSVFLNRTTTFVFYGILILSNFILYLFSRKGPTYSLMNQAPDDFSKCFTKCLFQTFRVLITIFGTSIFFYLISCIVRKYFVFSPVVYVFFNGLFDLTNGVISTSILSSTFLQGIFLFFFISFGSLSIHMQIKSILSDTSISYLSFLKGRFLSFLLCVFLWIIYSCCWWGWTCCWKLVSFIRTTWLIIDWRYDVNCIFRT